MVVSAKIAGNPAFGRFSRDICYGAIGNRFGNRGNGPGQALMTPEERTAMQAKMRAVKTYDECKLLQAEQHKTLEARAKEKGVTLPAPRQNSCDRMKARGLSK